RASAAGRRTGSSEPSASAASSARSSSRCGWSLTPSRTPLGSDLFPAGGRNRSGAAGALAHDTRRMRKESFMNGIRIKFAGGAAAAALTAIGVSSAAAAPYHPVTASIKHGTLTVKGSKASDKIALRLKAGDSSMLEVDAGDDGSADFSFARADIARIVVDGRAGNDAIRVDESNGVFEDTTPTILAGGDGRDTISGGSGAETLLGGPRNDSIDGNRGADTGLLGPGDDTFIWDPGDGSDKVEGQRGADTVIFNGANVAGQGDLSGNGV